MGLNLGRRERHCTGGGIVIDSGLDSGKTFCKSEDGRLISWISEQVWSWELDKVSGKEDNESRETWSFISSKNEIIISSLL